MKAITVLATIAIGIVYFGGAGQIQNEHSQVSGEWFDQQPTARRWGFLGDTLKLHRAIEGTNSGGVGAGVSPKTALAVGLKVDIDVLPAKLVEKIKKGQVNLDRRRTTRSAVAHDRLLLQNWREVDGHAWA
jgi:hypothetical protein